MFYCSFEHITGQFYFYCDHKLKAFRVNDFAVNITMTMEKLQQTLNQWDINHYVNSKILHPRPVAASYRQNRAPWTGRSCTSWARARVQCLCTRSSTPTPLSDDRARQSRDKWHVCNLTVVKYVPLFVSYNNKTINKRMCFRPKPRTSRKLDLRDSSAPSKIKVVVWSNTA